MSSGMAGGLLAGVAAAVLFGLAAVAQARAVRRDSRNAQGLAGFVTWAARNPWMLAVVGAYLVGFVLHAVAIWLLPLYLAQASVALSLPVTALASARLSELLTGWHWLGVGAVTAGLVLLAVGAGPAGDTVTGTPFAVAVLAGVVALLAAGLAVRRAGALTLGWLAGLGYAGSALAVRGVDLPLSAAIVIAALTVPAFGVVAFWLYSLALDRSLVSAASAPMITAQTFVPALAGLAWLGDGVREGWGAAIAAGLLLATAGTLLLSRDQAS
ncbi:hypothetical protein [Nocardioides sp. LHG3406-4]|uniref:hypothetical protein n=1 Tax=Nocardioides sp. LHG3406-4 TaxID=2804575 RepID=UPI003CEFAF04